MHKKGMKELMMVVVVVVVVVGDAHLKWGGEGGAG